MIDVKKIRKLNESKINEDKVKQIETEDKKISDKVIKFNIIFEVLEVPLDEILDKYKSSFFRDTKISKKDLFYRLINNKLTDEYNDFLTKSGNVTSHQNDKRSYREYACEIALSWLIEDGVIRRLLDKGIYAESYGSDRGREFLKQNEITTAPDIKVGVGDSARLIEIFIDWTDWWTRKGTADLRGSKFPVMVKERAFLLGLSPMSKTGFLIDTTEGSHGFIPSVISNYGGKSGFSTNRIKDFLESIDDVLEKLFNIFK